MQKRIIGSGRAAAAARAASGDNARCGRKSGPYTLCAQNTAPHTMSRWTALVLTALLGLGLSAPAAAQWKWRDNGGRIQYSDLPPPPGVAEGDILQRPNAAQ